MNDPLAQVIGLLQPSASFSKLVTATGRWAVRPPGTGPFYSAMLEGNCELSITGRVPVRLGRGDFMLIPAAQDFTVTSLAPPSGGRVTEPLRPARAFSTSESRAHATRVCWSGTMHFGSNDAALLFSLLPELVVVRSEQRLTTLVELLRVDPRSCCFLT